jgi:hypothetical protein
MIDGPLSEIDKLWRPDPGDPEAFDAAVRAGLRAQRARMVALGVLAVAAVALLFVLPSGVSPTTLLDTGPAQVTEEPDWYAAALDADHTPENDLLYAALFGGLED